MMLQRIVGFSLVVPCVYLISNTAWAETPNALNDRKITVHTEEQTKHTQPDVYVKFVFYGDEEEKLQTLLNMGTYCREEIQPSGATQIQCGPYTAEQWQTIQPLIYDITNDNYQLFQVAGDHLPSLDLMVEQKKPNRPYLNALTGELVTISQQQYQNGNLQAYQDQLPSRAVASGVALSEQWLSQAWGDAKFDIGLSLNAGHQWAFDHVEALLPFWQQNEQSLWFVQAGALFNRDNFHGRDFAHIGLGYRQLDEDQYFGINSFIDYDLSRQHRRMSIGAEYGINYFTFTSNVYFPISDWKDSPDLYEGMNSLVERAAKGWDLSLDTYLPIDNRVKFNLTAGQYLGRYVEHMDGSLPSEDPYHFSVNAEFNPAPEWGLTLGYQREQGAKDQYFAGVNYTLSLSGLYQGEHRQSHQSLIPKKERLTEFVQRDHNMVLEYKQKYADISIRLPESALVEENSQQLVANWMEVKGGADIVSYQWQGEAAQYLNDTQSAKPIFQVPAYRYDGLNQLSLQVVYQLRSGEVKQSNVMKIKVTDSKVLESLEFVPSSALAGENIIAKAKLSKAVKDVPMAFEITAENLQDLTVNGEPIELNQQQNILQLEAKTDDQGIAQLVLNSDKGQKVTVNAIYDHNREESQSGEIEWTQKTRYQVRIFHAGLEVGKNESESQPLMTLQTLSAHVFEEEGAAITDVSEFKFQWWRRAHDSHGEFEKITGATQQRYRLKGQDQGYQFKVTATN